MGGAPAGVQVQELRGVDGGERLVPRRLRQQGDRDPDVRLVVEHQDADGGHPRSSRTAAAAVAAIGR